MKLIWTAIPLVLLTGLALAVTPAEWTQTTEADFTAGKVDGVLVSSRGEVSLARKTEILLSSDKAPAVVAATATIGKTIYAASGVDGTIVKVGAGDKPFATVPGSMVCCLVASGKALLAGTGGEKAGLYRVDAAGKVQPVWVDEKVKYVWAVVPGRKGVLYVATGPEGKVYAVKGGKGTVVYEAGKLAKNILCLAAAPGGKLYAGTDENGLVVEIDPGEKTSRVLLDSAEKEISSVLPDGSGGLYAASSDVSRASADGKTPPNGAKNGKSVAPATKPAEKKALSRPDMLPPTKTAPAPAAPPKSTKTKPAPTKPDAEKKSVPSGRGDVNAMARRVQTTQPEPTTQPASEIHMSIGRGKPGSAKPAAPTMVIRRSPSKPGAPKSAAPAMPSGGKGNAVYHIAADGLVRAIFRRPVTILDLKRSGDKLILATGNGGSIYSVTRDGDEVVLMVKTDAKQVTDLTTASDGRIVFATANKGSVGVIEKALATTGTFTSTALDAKQIARWGSLQVHRAAGGGKVTIATRSGNVAEPDDKTWSEWSKEQSVDGGFGQIASPAGRFLQYRLTISAGRGGAASVRQVKAVYQVDNLRPVVAGILVAANSAGANGEPKTGPKTYRHIGIQAADPNGDKLRFKLEFRPIGTGNWVTIVKKTDKPMYIWDTQTVGDGTYELRVTASDAPANPAGSAREAARVSEPIVVDNTPPQVSKLSAKAADGSASVKGAAVDAGSRIVAISYSVDSAAEWVAILPTDGIADTGREDFTFEAKDLDPGSHRIAVRAVDLLGNVGYGVVNVTVRK
jgi:hypothetical protein